MAVIELNCERSRLTHPGRIRDIDRVGEVEEMLRADRKWRKTVRASVAGNLFVETAQNDGTSDERLQGAKDFRHDKS